MDTMKKIRNLDVNLLILSLTLTVMLILAETVVRVLYKNQVVLFPRYHTDGKYGEFTLRRMWPNTVFWHTSVDGSWKFCVNSRGLRNDKEFPYDKPDGTIRILCLGDSHTLGFEVRQDFTFPAIIEKYLKSRGYNVEVINTGISSFGTAEELVYLENEGIKYKPDFLVLGFFANDPEDDVKAGLFRLNENGELVVQEKAHIPGVRIQNIIYELPLVKWGSSPICVRGG